jgi:outer membrane protein
MRVNICRTMTWAAWLILASPLILSSASAGNAAESEKRYTLAEAAKTALQNNNELKAQKSSLFAKEEDIGIARSSLLPKISAEERYLRTASPGYAFMTKLNQKRIQATDFIPDSLNNPDAVNDFQTVLSVEQPLFARRASVGLEMSQKEAQASGKDFQRKKEEIAFRVTKYYLTVGAAAEYVNVAEKAREDAREHQRIAELRYNAGLGLYSDVLRAATASAEAESRLASAQRNVMVSRRALGLVMGFKEAIAVAESAPPLPVREADYVLEQALARGDVKALELRNENAKNNIKLAQSSYFPFLGIRGEYQLNDHTMPLGSEGDGWQVMAFLRWEAFDGTKRSHEKTKADHQATEALEYLEGMKKMVHFKVQEAFLLLEEAEKTKEFAQAAVKTAEEGRRLVRLRYEGSLSPLVDLLDAQLNFDQARAGLVARENDYRIATANLCYESGTILQDLGIDQ